MDTTQNNKEAAPKPTGQDAPKRPDDTTSSGDAKNGSGEDNHMRKKEK